MILGQDGGSFTALGLHMNPFSVFEMIQHDTETALSAVDREYKAFVCVCFKLYLYSRTATLPFILQIHKNPKFLFIYLFIYYESKSHPPSSTFAPF